MSRQASLGAMVDARRRRRARIKGAGVPADTIVIDGKTYRLLYSRTTGQYLTSRTTGEPLYGRAA